MRFNPSATHIYAKMSGDFFVLAGSKGYDSVDFAKKVMTTEYGKNIFNDVYQDEWLMETFLLEGFEREMSFQKGVVYSRDVLYYAGYLYRYWCIRYETSSEEVYKLAPIERIETRYGFYHTQDYDYVIEDLLEDFS